MNRFAYTYFNTDPDALGDMEAAQEKAERMADFMKDLRKEKELDELREAAGSAMWMCPICNHVMTEEQSKGYRGCPAGMHFAQHVPVELVPCPDCYGGHFRPCQMCGDTGMATRRLPNEKGQP